MTLIDFCALPLARLRRSPRGWITVVVWALLALGAAWVTRSAHAPAFRALGGAYGALALPLAVFGVTGIVLGKRGLADATRPLVAFGASPARAALAAIGTAMLASALVGALLGAVVCAVAHGPHDPPLGFDAAQTAGISALGAAAYAALFTFGSTFARGAGRGATLAIDFVLGGTGAGALLFPRGHVRSLLGGDAVMDLSGRVSTAGLVAIALVFVLLAVARVRRG